MLFGALDQLVDILPGRDAQIVVRASVNNSLQLAVVLSHLHQVGGGGADFSVEALLESLVGADVVDAGERGENGVVAPVQLVHEARQFGLRGAALPGQGRQVVDNLVLAERRHGLDLQGTRDLQQKIAPRQYHVAQVQQILQQKDEAKHRECKELLELRRVVKVRIEQTLHLERSLHIYIGLQIINFNLM